MILFVLIIAGIIIGAWLYIRDWGFGLAMFGESVF